MAMMDWDIKFKCDVAFDKIVHVVCYLTTLSDDRYRL